MLTSLTIRNFVLIQDASLEFSPRLTVLTGETGAGKTLLTQALGLLVGERAEDGLVGTGGEEALLQAVFELTSADVEAIPAEVRHLVELEAGETIVSRRLSRSGRNRCFVNDTSVTLATLEKLVTVLLSFAGQHEYRRLLDPLFQLEVLDAWAGGEHLALVNEYRTHWQAAREMTRRLAEAERTSLLCRQERESLAYQVQELSLAKLSAEEEAELRAEQRVLARAEDLQQASDQVLAGLSSDDGLDVLGLLAQMSARLTPLAGVDARLDELATRVASLGYEMAELTREIRVYRDQIAADPGRLSQIDDRLRTYLDLSRKYGGSTASCLECLAAAKERLHQIESVEDDQEQLRDGVERTQTRALELAGEMTEGRMRVAPRLESAVDDQLADLGMDEARLTVSLSSRSGWEGLEGQGADSVEFLLAANPGLPARSLARVASGGELSRILLGIKCALAEAGGEETLVFDEVDAGVGGLTAAMVGRKLRELSMHNQLIAVTHLARVAALADRHYLIEKAVQADRTVTTLTRLEGEAVVRELCRMMGGLPDDQEAMAHARRLRDTALEGLVD